MTINRKQKNRKRINGSSSAQTTDIKTKAAEIIKKRGNFKIYFKVPKGLASMKNFTFKKDVSLYVRQYIYHMLNDKPNIFKEFIENFYSAEEPQEVDSLSILKKCAKNFSDAIVYHNREVEKDQLKPKIVGKLIIEGSIGGDKVEYTRVLLTITGKEGNNLYNEVSNMDTSEKFIGLIEKFNSDKDINLFKNDILSKDTKIENKGKKVSFKKIISNIMNNKTVFNMILESNGTIDDNILKKIIEISKTNN